MIRGNTSPGQTVQGHVLFEGLRGPMQMIFASSFASLCVNIVFDAADHIGRVNQKASCSW